MTTTEILVQINSLMEKLGADDLMTVAQSAQSKAKGKTWIELQIGDKVMFNAKTRGIKHGILIKKNSKTYQVLVGSVTWKVTPTLLKKVA